MPKPIEATKLNPTQFNELLKRHGKLKEIVDKARGQSGLETEFVLGVNGDETDLMIYPDDPIWDVLLDVLSKELLESRKRINKLAPGVELDSDIATGPAPLDDFDF